MNMTELSITLPGPESAILIGIIDKYHDTKKVNEYLQELAFLTETAGAIPEKSFVQQLEYPDPKTFVGSGKLNEIKNYVAGHNTDLVIFDDELSPSQLRNIER